MSRGRLAHGATCGARTRSQATGRRARRRATPTTADACALPPGHGEVSSARSDQKPFTNPRMPLLVMKPNALVDGIGATTVVA